MPARIDQAKVRFRRVIGRRCGAIAITYLAIVKVRTAPLLVVSARVISRTPAWITEAPGAPPDGNVMLWPLPSPQLWYSTSRSLQSARSSTVKPQHSAVIWSAAMLRWHEVAGIDVSDSRAPPSAPEARCSCNFSLSLPPASDRWIPDTRRYRPGTGQIQVGGRDHLAWTQPSRSPP